MLLILRIFVNNSNRPQRKLHFYKHLCTCQCFLYLVAVYMCTPDLTKSTCRMFSVFFYLKWKHIHNSVISHSSTHSSGSKSYFQKGKFSALFLFTKIICLMMCHSLCCSPFQLFWNWMEGHWGILFWISMLPFPSWLLYPWTTRDGD